MNTCIEIILINEHLGNPTVFQCDSDEIEEAKLFAKNYKQKNGFSYKKESHIFSVKDIVLRERTYTTLHMKQHLKYVMEHYSTGELPQDYCLSVIRSYLGLMKYCDCDALRNKVVNDFALVKKFVEEYPDEEDYPDYF